MEGVHECQDVDAIVWNLDEPVKFLDGGDVHVGVEEAASINSVPILAYHDGIDHWGRSSGFYKYDNALKEG